MDWLREEVGSGLQALLSLRLNGTPAADMIQLTADIWVQAFGRKLGSTATQAVDAPRIREGFSRLFPHLRDWPAPADVIQSMPPRPPRAALPEPEPTPEQHRKNVRKAKTIVSELLAGWQNKGGN